MRLVGALALALALCASVTSAGERRFIGWSHVVANDSIGQFRDRWQSSAVQGSIFFGLQAGDVGRARLGEVLEFRLSSQIMTPENLAAPRPSDRLYAGALAFEVLSHGRLGAAEASVGLGIVAVGPQTGAFRFQRWLHELLHYPRPATAGFEVGDTVRGTVSSELARSYGATPSLRPFAEARTGAETILRAGVDATWGALGRGGLMIREPVTGQRVPGIPGAAVDGLSWTAGADIAWVGNSLYLPSSRGYEVRPRGRLRAGVHWQERRLSGFYGLAYLSPEFSGQRDGQFVGAAQVRFDF